MKKLLVIGTAIALFSTMGATYAAGDAAAGKAKSAVCAACHGADGNSMVPTFPKIAGQHAAYLEKALKALKAGKAGVAGTIRVDPVMSAQAAALSDDDIANLAAYFASQKAK
jgi:cytochrome c553